MSEYETHIPRYLDEPFRLILWTADELVALCVPFFFIGFYFDAILTGVIVGGVCFLILKKLKGSQGHHYLYTLMYWHLPALVLLKATPPSYIRTYLG